VSSPTMLPRPELGLRIVDATNTPPGLRTLLISATCKESGLRKSKSTPLTSREGGNGWGGGRYISDDVLIGVDNAVFE